MAVRKQKDPGEKRAKRQKTRAIISSFAGRFGVPDEVLSMWVALMGAELHVRAERLVEALNILDTMPPTGSASKPVVLRESILHLAKCLGLNVEQLKGMMDQPFGKPFEPPERETDPCHACGTKMVWKPAPLVGGAVQLCPQCHPEAIALADRDQVEA